MNDTRNLLLAFGLSGLVLFGFNYFYGPTLVTPPPTAATDTVATPPLLPTVASSSAATTFDSKHAYTASIQPDQIVRIDTPSLRGSLSLVGGALNDVTLKQYRQTPTPTSPQIELFEPLGTPSPYYAAFGWTSPDNSTTPPHRSSQWTASHPTLTTEQPVVLSYTTPDNVTFTRTLSVDDHYMFTIVEAVHNGSTQPVTVAPYSFVAQAGQSFKAAEFMAYYVGPLGVVNNKLREISYDDLKKETITEASTGGWIGFTDKYWLAAIIPDQATQANYAFRSVNDALYGDKPAYQVSATGTTQVIQPGKDYTITSHLFVGAKEVKLLDSYETTLNVPMFDRSVDFGWFYIITKPLFYTLSFLHSYVANMGVCILLLTVLIKLLFFPLANKSYRAMARMKLVQPKMQALQAQYANDKPQLNQEMMALYKKEKINPVSGCMPMLIQVPFFFGLYKVLFISLEMRQAPFIGWVHDLSMPDSTNLFTLFGLIPWDAPSFLTLGAWPIILGATMFLQQKMSPQPADPSQAKVMMLLPFIFTFVFASFPVGLVIYWAWNNLLSVGQQWVIAQQTPKMTIEVPQSKKKKS